MVGLITVQSEIILVLLLPCLRSCPKSGVLGYCHVIMFLGVVVVASYLIVLGILYYVEVW